MQHKVYQYGFLRESAQEYLLDKLQQLIQQKIISGTMENGTEYTIISIALNIDKKILRLIQGFDFTKEKSKADLYYNRGDGFVVGGHHLCNILKSDWF